MADRIHIANPSPPYCSSCFNAKPDIPHVDMGAAWDGPVVQGKGVVQHVIDDLILCENCIRSAGRLIGLGYVEAVAAELERAERSNDELLEKVRSLKAHVANLEAVRDNRPDELLNGKSKTRKRVAA